MSSELTGFVVDFFLAGISASISKTATAPIERVKLILLTLDSNPEIIKSGKRYNGITDTFLRVAKDDGVLTLWRGNGANLIRYFPTQAINFACKEKYKKLFNPSNKDTASFFRLLIGNLLAGGFAGATSMSFVYPLDLVRTRLAADIGTEKKEFTGIYDCLLKLYKSGGITGLYKGFGLSVIGIFIYRAAYFGLYDSSKPFISKNIFAKLALAQLVSNSSGLVAYPFDTVRRRMMMQSGKTGDKLLYNNSFDCVKCIFSKEGFKGFYKGALSNIFRGVGSSLVLVLYDELHEYFMPRALHAPWAHTRKVSTNSSPADGNEQKIK